MTSTTNHVDAAASSACAGVDGSGGGGAGSGSGGDEVCSLSDNEFQKFLEDATTFNRPLSEASPLFRALLDRKNDDDDVAAVGGAELRHLNSDCSHQTHRQRQNPRQRIPGTNPVSVSGGAGDGTCLDSVATSAVLRGAAARTTQGGSLQNLHVRPLAAERMEVDNSDDDGKERALAPVKQTEEVDTAVNFFLKPRVAAKAEDAKVLSRGEDKQTVQCLSNTGNSVTATANKIKNQTRRVLSREDEGYAPKHLDENGNPLGFDNLINQHSKTYPGSACNRSHLLPRVVSASDVRGGGGLQHLDSDSNLSCTGALGLAGSEGNERGIRSKTRRPKPTAGKDNVTTAEKIPGHFWDDNIEVMVDFINSVGSGGGFGKETPRQKGRKAQTPVNVRKEHQMVNGQQQHEAEEDADAEEEENAERKPRKKDKAKSKRQRMDANDRWSHLSDNSSASDDVGVVANEEEVADAGSDKMQEQDVVVKREVEVAPIPPQRLVASDPEPAPFKAGDCSATTGSATAQEAECAEFRADFYAVAVSEIPPCLEDDFHVVTGKKHRRGRSAGNPSGGANPGSSSSSSRGRARNSDPGERSRTAGDRDRDRDMMLWSGLHHYHRGHQRTSFGIGAGTDVDLRRKSTGSVPPSEHSSGDNSDIDSVHSLPVSSTTAKPSVDKTSASSSCTPHTSYADIARMASSSSASSSSCFPPIPSSQVPCVAAMDTEPKEAQATIATVVSAATSTVDTVTRGGRDIRDDDEAIMVVCGGGDTRFAMDNFTVDDEASRTSTEPSSPATPVVVDTSLAALAMGPVTGPWDDHSATPVVIIFADGLECENDSGRARAQVSFGFDVNEQLLRMTLSDGYLPEDVAGAPSSSSSSTADNVTVSVGFRFGHDPTTIGRDRNPLRETRWASYVPGKEGHRFNYVNVVNYIGQSWEIVRREMDGGSEGSIRYYSGDCM